MKSVTAGELGVNASKWKRTLNSLESELSLVASRLACRRRRGLDVVLSLAHDDSTRLL